MTATRRSPRKATTQPFRLDTLPFNMQVAYLAGYVAGQGDALLARLAYERKVDRFRTADRESQAREYALIFEASLRVLRGEAGVARPEAKEARLAASKGGSASGTDPSPGRHAE